MCCNQAIRGEFWLYPIGNVPLNFASASLNVSPILQNYQVDWEAILARSPTPFIQSVSPWLYPPAAKEAPHAPTGAGMSADSARVEEVLLESSQPEVEAAQAAAQADTTGQQQLLECKSFTATLTKAGSLSSVYQSFTLQNQWSLHVRLIL